MTKEIVDQSTEKVKKETTKPTGGVDLERRTGWLAAPQFTSAQKDIIKKTVARDLSIDEFTVFMYRARAYFLDPLKGEISVQVRNKDNPAKRQMVVIVQRDGYLTVAHRSGMFGGMQSGTKKVQDEETKKWGLKGWARVWNKAYPTPTEIEVDFEEYCPADVTYAPLWKSKPKTMIQKVAESQALRRAFNISGVYDTSEIDSWDAAPRQLEAPVASDDNDPATERQISTIKNVAKQKNITIELKDDLTSGEAKKQIADLMNAKAEKVEEGEQNENGTESK